MTRKKFNLILHDGGGVVSEVVSTDYDLDNGLVRYHDMVYDIKYGRWIVKLSHMINETSNWRGCGSYPNMTISKMVKEIANNKIFMFRLEKRRKEVEGHIDILNEEEINLFNLKPC